MIEEIARGKSRGDSNSQLLGCEYVPNRNADAVSLIMWGFLPYLVLTLNFPLYVMAISILLLFVKQTRRRNRIWVHFNLPPYVQWKKNPSE